MEHELVQLLAKWNKKPVTYAGGIGSVEQLQVFERLTDGCLGVWPGMPRGVCVCVFGVVWDARVCVCVCVEGQTEHPTRAGVASLPEPPSVAFLSNAGDLESFKKQSFVLKEGVEYRIKISFRVRRRLRGDAGGSDWRVWLSPAWVPPCR